MNKYSKLLVLFIAGSLVSTSLAGCSGSKKKSKNPVSAVSSASSASKEDSTWSKSVEARSALDNQDYASVESMAKKRISEQPNDASAHFLLGQALMGQKKYSEAKKSLETANSLAEDNQNYSNEYCRCLSYLAEESFKANDYSEAISLYKKLLAKNYELDKTENSLAQIYIVSAEKLIARGNMEDAETVLAEGASLVRNDTALKLALSELYISDDRLMEAERLLKKLVSANPNNPDCLTTYAALLQKMGDPNQASELTNKALSLDPNNRKALNLKGGLDGNMPVIAVNPTDNIELSLEAMNERIKYLEKAGNLSEEKKLLQACIEKYPDQIGAYYKLASVCEKMGLVDEAVPAIEKYNSLAPNSPEGMFLMARCYSQKGKCDEALELISKLENSGTYPNKFELMNERGQILARKGDFSGATTIWNSVLQQNPNDADASFYLGQLAAEMGKIDEAQKYFDTSIRIQPFNNKFRYFAGINYIQAGQKDKAAALWTASKANLNPSDAYGARIIRALGEDPELQAAAMQNTTVVSAANANSNVITVGTEIQSAPVTLNEIYESPSEDYEQALEYARTGHFNEAEQLFRKIIAGEPNNFNAYMNLGKVYSITSRQPKAAATFLKALKIDSRNIHALRALANSYSDVGMHAMAQQVTQQVKVNFPDQAQDFPAYANANVKNDPRAIEPMTKALLSENLNEEALAIVQGAISQQPESDALYLLQGDAYKQIGMFDLAMESYRHVQNNDQQSPASYLRIGDLYIAAGQGSQAVTEYRKALSTPFIDPDSMFYISDRMAQLGRYGDSKSILNKLKTMNLNMEQTRKLDQRMGSSVAEQNSASAAK